MLMVSGSWKTPQDETKHIIAEVIVTRKKKIPK